MEPQIIIRKATIDDAETLLALQKQAYQSEADLYEDPDIPPLRQTLAQMIHDLQTQVVLAACRTDDLIGSVRALLDDRQTARIGRLNVRPDCQNQGLGTKLLAAIEEALPDAERFELFTGHMSLRNLHLYQKAGYIEFDRQPVDPNLTLIFLRKVRFPQP